jgi:hypothetical protein
MTVLQGVRASVRPEEAQRKVKEWQDNFKAYQTALQRLSAAPSVPAIATNPATMHSFSANLGSVSAESAPVEISLTSASQNLDTPAIAAASST